MRRRLDEEHDITWHSLFVLLQQNWRIPFVAGISLALLVLLSIFFRHPLFTVTMRVVPVVHTPSSGLNSLANAAGLVGLGLGGSKLDSPFDHYRTSMISESVAAKLASDPKIMHAIYGGAWDPKTNSYRSYTSLSGRILSPLYILAGIPYRITPSAVTLQEYLKGSLQITASTTDDSVTISTTTSDPALTKTFLLAVHHASNEVLREKEAERARVLSNYLSQQLAQVTNQDIRMSMLQLLLEQQRILLMSQPGVSYAAEIIDQPWVSPLPTSPKPTLEVPLAFVMGAVLSIVAMVLWGPDFFDLRRFGILHHGFSFRRNETSRHIEETTEAID